MTKKLVLISKAYTKDEIGQLVATDVRKEVFCDVMSITSKEFLNAGTLGLKPKYEFRIWRNEYNGEQFVEYEGIRYEVYRTYEQGNGRIELYTQNEVGA